MNRAWFYFSRDYLRSLVRTGQCILQQSGQTDVLGRRVVYLIHHNCYCSITALDWENPLADLGGGLFFWGWYRPVRWWSIFPYWSWQTPSHPNEVSELNCYLLRRVKEWQIIRVLDILRHSRVIPAGEFYCATLLGAH